MGGDKMQNEKNEKMREKIKEIREEIEKYAEEISMYNRDNISLLREEDFESATEIAKKLIEECSINLYYSYLARYPDSVFDLLASESEEEFLKNFEEYRSDMEEWAEIEEKSFYDVEVHDNIDGSIDDIDAANYIVKVYYVHSAHAHGQLCTVICCDSKEEAEKVASIVWNEWGDYGIVGANIGTSIKQVNSETSKEILEEYCDDILRFYKNNCYDIEHLRIIHASEVLNEHE